MKVTIQKLRGSKQSRGGPRMLTMEAWSLKMKPWRACRPVVADSHHIHEEQDPDPHLSERLDEVPH
jgi:hypothetical protein